MKKISAILIVASFFACKTKTNQYIEDYKSLILETSQKLDKVTVIADYTEVANEWSIKVHELEQKSPELTASDSLTIESELKPLQKKFQNIQTKISQ